MCVCELDMSVSEAVDEGGGIAGDGVLFVDLTSVGNWTWVLWKSSRHS